MEILEQIETQNAQIETLRAKLPTIEKMPLSAGLEGYGNPKVYGIYKQGGSDCLGVSRNSYKPANLSLFLDTIVNSCIEADINLDINKLEYREYKNGKKVTFRIPLKDFEIESPMKGDIMKSSLLFTTGFDVSTKSSLTYSTYRIWCSNGAGRWDNGYSLSFKNTKNNGDKYLLFTEQMIKTAHDVEDYVKYLGDLSKKPVTPEQLDYFYLRITGVNKHNYEEAHGKSKKIFDSLQNAFMIESNNTGMNAFSLLQAGTRYATHELAEVEEDLYFGNAATFNQTVHQVVYSLN
jgi:hypothetical protein